MFVFYVVFNSCEGLQEVILTDNKLRRLPNSIGRLSRLFHLNVDKNILEYLPSDLGHLSAISVLSLRDNRLVRLPNEIGQLKEMTVLDVAENRLVLSLCRRHVDRFIASQIFFYIIPNVSIKLSK